MTISYTTPLDSTPADPATNRLTIELYDYHGQQLSLFAGEQNTVFPRWNQDLEEIVLIEEGSFGQAVYDSNSERVKEDSRYFLRDLDGKVLSEFEISQLSFQWKRDYIYRGSQMVAAQDSSDGLLHFHLDHLGSPRMVSTAGGYVSAKHNYGPFGFEISSPYQNDITKKYTSHERDNLNAPATKYDLDYMHARYYSPWQHRFLSVDPIGGDPRQPQSWNAFSYVLNNPMNLVDPYGMIEWDPSRGGWIDQIDVTGDEPDWYRNLMMQRRIERDYLETQAYWERTNGYGNTIAGSVLSAMSGQMQRPVYLVDDVLPAVSDFSAGFGDFLSFGITAIIRSYTPGAGSVDFSSGWYWSGFATGAFTASVIRGGPEPTFFGKNLRIAPYGNRTGHPTGGLPHYHRRGVGPNGSTRPGQGIGRHRPWDRRATDIHWWERF